MKDEPVLLLVEDNEDEELLTIRALRKNHIHNPVVVARDGQEAIDVLCGGLIPAVVILDLKLPKLSGLQVLERVRSNPRTRLLPVVVLTSSREEQDIVESYRLGANSYVRKPVDFAQFAEAVRQLGLYWVLLNEPPPEGR
jgi:two-component system, response regulator